jgi:hypothetical protein
MGVANGYEIFDTRGHVGRGPNANSLRKLKKALDSLAQPHNYFQVRMFLNQGYASSPLHFSAELAQLADFVADETTRDSLKQLQAVAQKCSNIVILESSFFEHKID